MPSFSHQNVNYAREHIVPFAVGLHRAVEAGPTMKVDCECRLKRSSDPHDTKLSVLIINDANEARGRL